MSTEPICVRRTATLEEAEIVVAWLAEQGIQATIADPSSTGVIAFGVTDEEGVEVFVTDEETADRAEKLLDDHDEQMRARHASAGQGPVEVTCDECRQASTYQASDRGTVQDCKHCGAHLDVPD